MDIRRHKLVTAAILAVLLLTGATSFATTVPLTEAEAQEIAVEAYVYLYPLVTMDVTRRVMTNVAPGVRAAAGPPNEFAHVRTYPTADFRDVVRPNFDTLYSVAWLDLTKEPAIITVPDTSGRYYLLPMIDMWTDVFAVPGKRTSGTGAARFAIVPRGWRGKVPEGVAVIEAPTPHVWIIGRTQTNGPKDYDAVRKIQDGFTITPLSRIGRKADSPAFTPDPTVDMKTPPPNQVNSMSAETFFAYAAELMKVNPPHLTDWSILARMKRIGLEPGRSFDPAKADPVVRAAMAKAPEVARRGMQAMLPTIARVVNGWQMNTDTMGVYGNYYLKRAIIAAAGLGANQALDAVYPLNVADADGNPVEGGRNYVMHFARSKLPPVGAFWSLTLYDAEGFQVANPLNRFAIGDRDALKYNADGSLDLYIQPTSPGADKESNWLPAPSSGRLGLTMRLYAPKLEVLSGKWAPPPVTPAD